MMEYKDIYEELEHALWGENDGLLIKLRDPFHNYLGNLERSETLETIELGGLNLKGKNMNSSKDEATLDFFVTYNVPAISEEQAGILMRTLELNKEVKGE